MTKKFYRPDEVMTILDISKATFYRRIKDPLDPIPAHKMGQNGDIRVNIVEFEKYLEDHKIRPEE